MEITERNDGRNVILQIDDARIVYRNFSGVAGKFNPNGERSFAVVIGDGVFNNTELTSNEICDRLEDYGWHVKRKPALEDGEEPFNVLPVKVKFMEGRNPAIYINDGENVRQINEELVGMIDDLNISSVDMDIRPYHWEMGTNSGTTAYLQSICVNFTPDRFAKRVTM